MLLSEKHALEHSLLESSTDKLHLHKELVVARRLHTLLSEQGVLDQTSFGGAGGAELPGKLQLCGNPCYSSSRCSSRSGGSIGSIRTTPTDAHYPGADILTHSLDKFSERHSLQDAAAGVLAASARQGLLALRSWLDGPGVRGPCWGAAASQSAQVAGHRECALALLASSLPACILLQATSATALARLPGPLLRAAPQAPPAPAAPLASPRPSASECSRAKSSS
jgi:hypothetical protein